ncbi:CDP-alcohol phosphatidyltransferase family protein [Haloarchaeobius amylolyticus]|uniref:CDP-alcohol phosphatidyltransferase family protein n=1 Tax=Haloarchaeobius amylolyticus TaxID=1198296 RepID=UPI00226F9D66|nr:CDP-alcohol phosphatidyltransferase family protein [Haloarchaeobius amylolyticus]
MSDESERAGSHLQRTLGRSARRTGFRYEPGNILYRLTVADYVSLVALFFAWTASLLFLSGESNYAVVVMFVAFLFDKLDGYLARRLDVTSSLGRQVDSFIDIFVYLVTAALLFYYELAPRLVLGAEGEILRIATSAVVGFCVLAFGGLRLIRHNNEGFIEDDTGTSHYHGITVVHVNAVVVLNYLLVLSVAPLGLWNGWAAAATTMVVCPLMVSDYRSPKTEFVHWVVGAACVVVSAAVLWVEFGLSLAALGL